MNIKEDLPFRKKRDYLLSKAREITALAKDKAKKRDRRR